MAKVPDNKSSSTVVTPSELIHGSEPPVGRLTTPPKRTLATAQGDLRPSVQLPRLVLALVFVTSAVYAVAYMQRGWIPNDEGTLAQSAIRVLQGQLPHRDFVEAYTGGLSYYHALAFRLFGTNLLSLRLAVLVVFLAWIPAVFYVASRFVSAIPAGAVTLLAVVWSLPNYPAAMPSWYNLFLAVFGMVAVLHYIASGRRRWLFAAGIFGGLSFLVKIIGLYYVAAVLLFFVYCEQSETAGATQSVPGSRQRVYRVFIVCSLLVFLGVIIWMVHTRLGSGELFHFVLPAAAMVALLILRELKISSPSSKGRFARLCAMLFPFLAGFAIAVCPFLFLYVRSGFLNQFVKAVFSHGMDVVAVMGFLRPPGAIELVVFVVPLFVLIAIGVDGGSNRRRTAIATSAVLGAGLLGAVGHAGIARLIWYSAIMATPLIVCWGAAILFAKPSNDQLQKRQQQELLLTLSVAAVCSLVQFPFAAPIYVCYFAPLSMLALTAIVATQYRPTRSYILGALLAFYISYAVVRLGPGFIYDFLDFDSGPQTRLVRLSRSGGLHVQPTLADFYERVIPQIREHAGNRPIVAGPDSPELYFLSELPNATRNDSRFEGQELLQAIVRDDVREVVINTKSFPIPEEIKAEIVARFPYSVSVGKFQIRWRS
jgi:hypothetical protein